MLLIKMQENKSTLKKAWINVYLTQNKNRSTFYVIKSLIPLKRVKFKKNRGIPKKSEFCNPIFKTS